MSECTSSGRGATAATNPGQQAARPPGPTYRPSAPRTYYREFCSSTGNHSTNFCFKNPNRNNYVPATAKKHIQTVGFCDRGGGDQCVDIHHGHDCGQECCDEEEEHHIRGSLIRIFEPFLSTLGQYPNDSIPAPYKTTLTQPPIDEAKGNIESSDNKDG